MNNNYSTQIKLFGLFVLVLSMFSSCVPVKEQIYLQTHTGEEDTITATFYQQQPFEFKITPGNNLYVKITSDDDDINKLFGNSPTQAAQDASLYIFSYSVNGDGYIDIPNIGKILVKDLTIEEAKDKITESVKKELRFATVVVKLVNYNLSVLGEVNRPAMYKIYQERVSVFEAIAMAGDMTIAAKRGDVVLIRKQPTGVDYFHINLLEDDFLQSEYYYLMPGDIIYVPPVKNKNYVFTSAPYALVLSTISTIILIATFLNR